MSNHLPPKVITFGSDATCNLDNCPVEWSLYGYRPSLAANASFLAIFLLIGLVHGYLGYRWRSWGFMTGMLLGCVSEVVGYGGRIMLYNNPFSFVGFMVQIGKSARCYQTRDSHTRLTLFVSLPYHSSSLLHRIHLRHALQDDQLLFPGTIPIQPSVVLLDLHSL
jgi:hypothetical protein